LYLSNSNVQLNQIGLVDVASLNSIGTGYTTTTGVTTIGGNGVGLILDIVDDGSGGVLSFTIVNGGSGYAQGDIVTIDAGNQDATITIDEVINTIVGSGCTINFVANNIGGCSATTLTAAGTGYIDSIDVATTGGTGTGLTVDVIEDGSGGVASIIIKESGLNYTIGDPIIIQSGNNDATFTIDAVTNGEVTEITIFEGGTNYSIGDTFIVNGGNNDSNVSISYIGKGSFGAYNGVDKIFAYWL